MHLVGSLTTAKPSPKDIDILVTVDRTVDILQLAKLGRKLKGRARAIAGGADIFLCSPSGQYLGRTCSYRECRFRASCTGNQCGRGTYICNDFNVLVLDEALIEAPPIEVWPKVVRRQAVPEDVEAVLLARGVG